MDVDFFLRFYIFLLLGISTSIGVCWAMKFYEKLMLIDMTRRYNLDYLKKIYPRRKYNKNWSKFFVFLCIFSIVYAILFFLIPTILLGKLIFNEYFELTF
ncbi:hypothetical protein MCAV_01490 [[Mycoplasma] cavipharyngis]